MKEYYTYAYMREDGTPYYIGKGSGKRVYKNNGRYCNKPSKNRIIFLKKNLTEEEAFKHEIYMIAIFGRKDLGTGILHNRTDGGEGSSGAVRSEDLKKRISKSLKGKPKTKLHNERVSKALKGKDINQDIKTKISKSLKGRKLPADTREKLSQSLKQRWKSGKFTGNTGVSYKKNNPSNLKTFYLTSPIGISYIVKNGLKKFCEEKDISYNTIYYGLHYKNGNCTNGWRISYE